MCTNTDEKIIPTTNDSEIAKSFIDSVSAWFQSEEDTNRYKVITICGSHKFRSMFSVVKRELIYCSRSLYIRSKRWTW